MVRIATTTTALNQKSEAAVSPRVRDSTDQTIDNTSSKTVAVIITFNSLEDLEEATDIRRCQACRQGTAVVSYLHDGNVLP